MNFSKFATFSIEHYLRHPKCQFLKPKVFVTKFSRNYPEAPKRFYKNVTVAGSSNTYEINLDHKKLKTPLGNILQVSSYPLALAVANEWSAVDGRIVSSWMHLTNLANTVQDNPLNLRKWDVVDQTLEFLITDTLLFMDGSSEKLLALQREKWEPIMEWFNTKYGVELESSAELLSVDIPIDTKESLRRDLLSYDMESVTGIFYAVEAVKSLILALAVVNRRISVEEAVTLSLLETEFQTDHWGNVAWAHSIDRENTRAKFSAAVLFVHLNLTEYDRKVKGAVSLVS